MKKEIIKPNSPVKESKSLLTPIVYLILGVVLAFMSDKFVQIALISIGILIFVYGIKTLFEYYRAKDLVRYKQINLTIGIASLIIGILLVILSTVIERGLRYILGFFLIYFGLSRLLTQISFNDYKNLSALSNIALIIMGLYSIFISNVLFVIIGCLLIVNAIILFIDYFRN